MTTKTPRTGRPTKVDQIVRHRQDGTPVTAGQQVIERIRLGLDYQASADTADVSRSTLHHWRRWGAKARLKEVQGEKLDRNDAIYRDFLDALERAQADAELDRLAVIQRATTPYPTERVTEKWERRPDPNNPGQTIEVLVERNVVRETQRPQWQPAAWWLERRMPQKYARRYELTGADGGPIAITDRAAQLAADLEAFQAGAAAGVQVGRTTPATTNGKTP